MIELINPDDIYSLSQNWQYQNTAWNLSKVMNKDLRKISIASFRCLHCSLWKDFTYCCSVSIVNIEQINTVSLMTMIWENVVDAKNIAVQKILVVEYFPNKMAIC